MRGRIVRGIAGFYYVQAGSRIYECKAKGIFRKDKKKPLPGDYVKIDILDEGTRTANISTILPRTNELIRPAVANVDQALVIMAAASPAPNLNLLDRFLVTMEKQKVHCCICFNKQDLVEEEEKVRLLDSYRNTGYRVLFTSARQGDGLEDLRQVLADKTTTVAGPSGVGKSSLINRLQTGISMETGEISVKIERGKHTTRHSELIYVSEGTYIVDTPGFSSIELYGMEKEELQEFFPEFVLWEPKCRFAGCAHIKEPDCGVKTALEQGEISRSRYENYCQLYEELKDRRKYRTLRQ